VSDLIFPTFYFIHTETIIVVSSTFHNTYQTYNCSFSFPTVSLYSYTKMNNRTALKHLFNRRCSNALNNQIVSSFLSSAFFFLLLLTSKKQKLLFTVRRLSVSLYCVPCNIIMDKHLCELHNTLVICTILCLMNNP
jgi:hypothetical protein